MTRQRKSAAQVLFERLIRTWVLPEANRRHAQNQGTGGIGLRVALLVWEQPDRPSIFLNDEVFRRVLRLDVIAAGPVNAAQPVTSEDIQGLRGAILRGNFARYPYIFLLQGRELKFYIASRNTTRVLQMQDFETLRQALATEGVVLSATEHELNVYLDVVGTDTTSDRRHINAAN